MGEEIEISKIHEVRNEYEDSDRYNIFPTVAIFLLALVARYLHCHHQHKDFRSNVSVLLTNLHDSSKPQFQLPHKYAPDQLQVRIT